MVKHTITLELDLADCKQAIKDYVYKLGHTSVLTQNIEFEAVYTSGGHDDNGPPKTTGCRITYNVKDKSHV